MCRASPAPAWYAPHAVRIAHLSDPHLLDTRGARIRDFLNKRWIGGLNLIANRAREHRPEVFEALVHDINNGSAVDHVLCTGDVTNVALPTEFEFSRRHFDRLRHGTHGTTVIPGNHDTYVAAGVPLFQQYFGDFHASDAGWGEPWPAVRVRGPVAIVACTTAHPTPWFTAYGSLGAAQLARLEQVLTDARLADKFRLVAVHHPPAGKYAAHLRHGLRDWRAFGDVIRRAGAELVLHGHEHEDLHHELPGPAGDAIAVRGIQSATYAGGRARMTARYRIYEIDARGPGRPRLAGEELRVWSADRSAFQTDA